MSSVPIVEENTGCPKNKACKRRDIMRFECARRNPTIYFDYVITPTVVFINDNINDDNDDNNIKFHCHRAKLNYYPCVPNFHH